jgi:hypothetical protein
MSKYKVNIFETLVHTVEIVTDNEDTAIDIAYEIVENETSDIYTTTSLGTYDSDVEEIDNA